MRRHLLATGAVVGLAACGTDPSAVLTINVNTIPAVTTASPIGISGTVSRDPEKNTVIVVSVAGGLNAVVDTVAEDGTFHIGVALKPNRENQLAITASDATGSVGSMVAVILHDNTPPPVVSQIPEHETDSVAFDTAIELRFGEPLVPTAANAGLMLLHNSFQVAGTSVLSGDGTRLTFTPDQPLAPNSVYEMVTVGLGDAAGNLLDESLDACFITTSEGFATRFDEDEPDSGVWATVNPAPSPTLDTVNMIRTRMARGDTILYGLIEFSGPRSFAENGLNSATAVLEFDIDQDSTTGYISQKDLTFGPIDNSFSSGTGVELLVAIEPRADLGDSAYVAVYFGGTPDASAAADSITVVEQFLPGVCGNFFGFHSDFVISPTVDDGAFDFVLMAFASDPPGGGAYVDPAPAESGHFSVDLASTAPRLRTQSLLEIQRFGQARAVRPIRRVR